MFVSIIILVNMYIFVKYPLYTLHKLAERGQTSKTDMPFKRTYLPQIRVLCVRRYFIPKIDFRRTGRFLTIKPRSYCAFCTYCTMSSTIYSIPTLYIDLVCVNLCILHIDTGCSLFIFVHFVY